MPYDLDAGTLTYSIASGASLLRAGDLINLSYRVFSVGTEGYSGAVTARVFLSQNLIYDTGDRLLIAYTQSISSFQFFFGVDATQFINVNTAPGRYNLILQVDPDQQIAESDEINNYLILSDLVINRSDLTATTTADLFARHGQLAIMAQLAAAAYHLTVGETVVSGINQRNTAVDPIFNALAQDLTMLNARDMPTLARTDLQGIDFPVSGLRNGIYTNQNAAALLARSADAVFLAFRGTNDNNGDYGMPFSPSPETPDGDHWVGKDDHFALFQLMLTALAEYMSVFGLNDLYVTGHSLGAAMVQAFMLDHPGLTLHADTFASPGYGVGVGTDSRMSNLWIDGDPITTAALFAANIGDQNKIYHNLKDQILALPLTKVGDFGIELRMSGKEKLALLHSVTYYVEFTKAMQDMGIGEDALTNSALHGIDYDRVYINAIVNGNGNVIVVGGGADSITASNAADIVLGHIGNDTLMGQGGDDHIDGGAQADWLYGGAGSDYLYGVDGTDRLYGGDGQDLLTGGAGADHFVFLHAEYFGTPGVAEQPSTLPVPKSLNDTITDFQIGVDKINLANIDPSLAPGNQAFEYLGTGRFTSQAGQVRVGHLVAGDTVVQGDLDGDGKADFSILLIGRIVLGVTDFVL